MKPACIHTNLRSLSLFGTLEIHIRLLHVCTCTRSPPHTYALARTPTHARPRTHARTYARLRARIYTHTYAHTYSHHILTLTQAAAETTRKNAEAISAAEATVAAAATREEKERVAAVAKRGKKERAAAAVSVFLFWLKQIV